MRTSSLIMMFLAISMAATGCSSGQPRAAASTGAPLVYADTTAPRLRDADLEQRGMELWWQSRLPVLKEGDHIRTAYMMRDLIVMESVGKQIFGVDRKSGVPTLVADLPYASDFAGCEDDGNLYVTCRNVLVGIDKRGYVTFRKYLKFAPAGVGATDEEHVFLPCFDGALRSYLKDLGQQGYFDRQYTTGAEIQSKPAVGTRYVYTGSNDGMLYALTVDKLDADWTYKTYGPIRAGVVKGGRFVYVASTDGSLYCLNDMAQATPESQLAWPRPYATGAPIKSTPFVTKELAIVVNENRECHAVDAANGRQKWMVPAVERVLAQGKQNTYVLQAGSRILAIDSATGVVRWSMETGTQTFDFILTNDADDTIYLVKKTGEIQAMRERRRPTPPPAPIPAPAAPEAVAPEAP